MKKRFLLPLLCVLVLALASFARMSAAAPPWVDFSKINPDTDLLLVLDGNGKYGFIDTKGNVVIRPQLLLALPFSDGLASVVTKDCHGYIDKTGRLVLQTKYDACWPFIDGHAIFGIKDKEGAMRYGIMDQQGNVVVQPIYLTIRMESDGMMAFRDSTGACGYFDADCNVAIPAVYSEADDFYNGEAAVLDAATSKCLYIDKTGKPTGTNIESDYSFNMDTDIFDAGEGLARQASIRAKDALESTARAKLNTYKYCGHGLYWDNNSRNTELLFADNNGSIKFHVDGSEAGVFSEGLCAVRETGEEWRYVDGDGNLVIGYINNSEIMHAESFKNGVAMIDRNISMLQDLHMPDDMRINESREFIKISYIDRTGHYIWKQPVNLLRILSRSVSWTEVLAWSIIILLTLFMYFPMRRRPKQIPAPDASDAPEADDAPACNEEPKASGEQEQ